jgi:hypothetical protein
MAVTRPAEEATIAALKMTRRIRTSHPISFKKGAGKGGIFLVSRGSVEINILT